MRAMQDAPGLGQSRSLPQFHSHFDMKFVDRFNSKVAKAKANECWLWLGAPDTGSLGYGRITVDGAKQYAHRMAYRMAVGSIDDDHVVRHSCDCPACVNPRHLIAGTQADNVADMNAKKRQGKRLNAAKAREIDRLDRECGLSHKVLAKRFGVSETAIRRLLSGATWGSVTGRKRKPSRTRATAASRANRRTTINHDTAARPA